MTPVKRLIHGATFREHGSDDIVTGIQILKKIVKAIAPIRRIQRDDDADKTIG